MEESLLNSGPGGPDNSARPVPVPPSQIVGDLTGRDLGDFHLLKQIGAGGMGQVYLARQKSLKREVAVKILKPELAANRQALLRFRAEAEAVARINHANIVQIFAVGEQDGIHFMALEYVDGRNLREYVARKGPPELPIVLNIIRQVAHALQRAHEQGFVHRDIKPDNILLTRKGEVKVADFGLSRAFGDDALHLTQSGVTMGTPLYMSPEQVQGRNIDPRSDIYSLGITCWHMLAGSPPFHGATAFEVALQHVQNVPPSLVEIRPDLPPLLVAMVEKMIAKPVDARYQSAKEILRDLAALRETAPNPSATLAALPAGDEGSETDRTTADSTPVPSSDPVRRRTRVGVVAGVLGTAFLAGLGVHWASGETPASSAPESPPGVVRVHVRERREKDLIAMVANRELLPIKRIDHVLELMRFHIQDRQFDKARAAAERLADIPVLPDSIRKKDARVDAKTGEIVLLLAQGIVLAHEDRAEESVKLLTDALGPRPTGKPLLDRTNVNTRLIEYIRAESKQWALALAEAIQRDIRNDARIGDERLRRYQHPTAVRPPDEVKKP